MKGEQAGLLVGTVTENWNADAPGQIKVEYAAAEGGKKETTWIYTAVPYGGDGYGIQFLPEIGEQVVIGFLFGNRSWPVALGSIRVGSKALPENGSHEKNQRKTIMTKGGCRIEIFEEQGKEKIVIRDPKNENSMVMDSERGEIALNAKTRISLGIDGVEKWTLEKDKLAVEIKEAEIKGDSISQKGMAVTLDTGKGAALNLNRGQAELKSQQLKIEGTALEAKGKTSLKLECGGIAQIKGAMVQLN